MDMQKRVVIDGRSHLMGRLASIVAKQLLLGQRVVVVRCEEINISGPMIRNRLRFQSWLNKHSNINRRHGAVHYRAPSKIFMRTVRGMLPRKTARGAEALGRLKTFEGVPPPYDKEARVIVPGALRVLRLKQHRA